MKAKINNVIYEQIKLIEIDSYENGKLQITQKHISIVGNGYLNKIVFHNNDIKEFKLEGVFYWNCIEFIFIS